MKQSDFRPLGLPVLAATICLLLLAAPATAATFFTQPINAAPGQEADVCIWMSGGNNQVAGVQMDLTWDSNCMTPPAGNRPRCRSNPDTGKTVQSAARGASTVRAIMLSFSDVDPIPDGELFCCGFRIAASPPEGQCSVSFSNLIASTPTGQRTDARGGRGGAVNITRSGGGAPAPAPGGYDPAPPPADSGRSDDPAPVAAPPAAPAGDARADAAPGQVDAADAPGSGGGRSAGATDLAGLPGRPASGDGEYAGERPQAGLRDDTGRVPDSREMPAAVAEPAQAVVDGDDDDDVAESTPTQTPEAAAAQATVAPTATKPPATPTQAQPTATPTTSSGWLGGCTLMR